MIGYPAGHYSDANINDHHFHYGYFVQAAAAVEQFQPGWAASWGPMINLLIKDAANPERNSTQFPFLRHFNPYAGHAFAAGLLNNEPHGNNQESSSEAMNFNASLIHWGTLTGNTAIRDLGIYLYTTEQTAIEEYWFDQSDRNFAPTYAHKMCSRVWGNGYDRNTFWTGDIAAMYGINMFPMTASSLYLGHNKTYAASLWNNMTSNTGVLSNVSNDNLWYETYWSYLAFSNPAQAVSLYNNFPNYKLKFGNSDAHTYHWLHSFNGMGTLDATVTANYPIASVFTQNSNKTYVAHNYGSSPITVTFSDGYSMQVPARTLKTSKDIDVTATVVASAMQVASNGSVELTANVTGSGITKVEFYDGPTLLATSTVAPYTTTVNNLTARVHGFYAKVYVGSSLELSNVVSVTVGAQRPYQNTMISIPTQVLEPGNYDYYEGGVGQNISYFDVTTTNDAGTFRAPEYVDAAPTTGEGNTVSWIDDGEWLEYTVNIEQAGTYDLSIRYASGNAAGGGPFHMEVDGNVVTPDITVPFSGTSWTVWSTKTVPAVILPAGQHVIRLVFEKGGYNLGKISFTYKGSASPTLTLSENTTTLQPFANSTKNIAVTANIGWNASSNQSWLQVTPATGFADDTLRLTAQENPTTESRTATVTVTGNGISNQLIQVTQLAGGAPYVLVSPSSMQFAYNASTPININVTSNQRWLAVSSEPWLTLSAAGDSGIATITASAATHAGTSGRNATITISSNGVADQIIAVTQAGAPIIIALPITFEQSGTYVFTDFDGGTGSTVANPLPTAGNNSSKVGKIVRNGGATWGGSYLTLNQKINFASQPYFTMKVFSARAGVPVLLKMEGDVGPSEVLTSTTVANGWETLTWNFTGKPSNVYNKLVFMFDFGTVGNGSANSTFYFDDVNQVAQPFTANWTGSVSTNWNTAGNWSTNAVPTSTTEVIIPAGRPRYPLLQTTTTVKSVLCANGATLSIAPGVILNVLK